MYQQRIQGGSNESHFQSKLFDIFHTKKIWEGGGVVWVGGGGGGCSDQANEDIGLSQNGLTEYCCILHGRVFVMFFLEKRVEVGI